jgi:hypothetical protein
MSRSQPVSLTQAITRDRFLLIVGLSSFAVNANDGL